MHDLEARLANRIQLTTDGHRVYVDAVESAFGSRIDCAMLVKMYGNDAEGEEFGEHRLIEALRRHRGESSQALVSVLLDEVRQFNPNEQQDDITLIVANCRESLEPT